MGLTSNNNSADISQYLNNEELERLNNIYLHHILTTTQIQTTIDYRTKKIASSTHPPRVPITIPRWFQLGD